MIISLINLPYICIDGYFRILRWVRDENEATNSTTQVIEYVLLDLGGERLIVFFYKKNNLIMNIQVLSLTKTSINCVRCDSNRSYWSGSSTRS